MAERMPVPWQGHRRPLSHRELLIPFQLQFLRLQHLEETFLTFDLPTKLSWEKLIDQGQHLTLSKRPQLCLDLAHHRLSTPPLKAARRHGSL